MTPRKPMLAASMNERISCCRSAVPRAAVSTGGEGGGVEAVCGDGSGTFHHDKAIARAITNLRLRNASAKALKVLRAYGLTGFGAWRPEACTRSQPTLPSHHISPVASASNTSTYSHDLHLLSALVLAPATLSALRNSSVLVVRSLCRSERGAGGFGERLL